MHHGRWRCDEEDDLSRRVESKEKRAKRNSKFRIQNSKLLSGRKVTYNTLYNPPLSESSARAQKKETQRSLFWLNCRDSKGGPEGIALARIPLKIKYNYSRNPPLSESSARAQKKRPKGLFFWLNCRDSNPERQNQNLLCYHYTTVQSDARKRDKGRQKI